MEPVDVLKVLAPLALVGLVAGGCGGSSGVDFGGPTDVDAGPGTTPDGAPGPTDGSGPGADSPGPIPDAGGGDAGPADAGCVGAVCGVGTYVSGNTGLDANPGTLALPVKTIGKGILNAVALGGAQSVFVAGTHYPEKVTMVDGVSLLGGHQCDMTTCTWKRDPKMFDTAILNQDFEGVLAPPTVTKATRFDGFRVQGMPGAPPAGGIGSVGITINGSTPIVSGNRINAGDVNGGVVARSIGVAVIGPQNSAAGAQIDGNVVNGGVSTLNSFAVLLASASAATPAVAVIARNLIRGGAAPTTLGIAAFTSGAATVVRSNDITAGTSAGNVGLGAWGISVNSAITIDSNRINVDQSTVGACGALNWCGGIVSQSFTSTITNNIVFGVKSAKSTAILLTEAEVAAGAVILNANYLDGAGGGIAAGLSASAAVVLRIGNCGTCGTNAILGKARNNILMGGNNGSRYGVFEEQVAGKTNHPQALDNNDFFFAPAGGRTDVLYHSWNGATAADLTTLIQVAAIFPSANISANPLVDATFHLSKAPASPCINAGTATEAPATDMEGDARPAGAAVDIGADEAL